MRPGSLSAAAVFAAIFTAISWLLASCSTASSNSAAQTKPAAIQPGAPVEENANQVHAGALVSKAGSPPPTLAAPVQAAPSPIELAASQPAPGQDGLAVLKAQCTGCHEMAWFVPLEKSRLGWEESLGRMAAMGVRLTGAEKDALLDYLAAVDEP